MELYNLKNNPGEKKKRKRVGRGPGSGHGKTSCRGQKGQKSRAGYSRHFGFEGGQMPLHRRLPKRGFNHEDRWPMSVVNVDALEKAFEAGAEVTAEAVVATGLVRPAKGGLKVLGRGELTKKLTVKVQAITPSAQKKIEAAGGTVEIIAVTPATPKAEVAENAE
jgi:large subunit ribosomal protein L15